MLFLFSQTRRRENLHVAASGAQTPSRSSHTMVRLSMGQPQINRRQSNTQLVTIQAARRDCHSCSFGHAETSRDIPKYRGRISKRTRSAPKTSPLLTW